MVTWLLVGAMLAAAPAAPAHKLAAPPFSGLRVDAQTAEYYTQQFAQQLSLLGVPVITPQEIAALLGVERQRQLLACVSNCAVEIGLALDASGVVTGSLGRFGDEFQVDIKVVSAKNGAMLSAFSTRVRTERALLDAYAAAAREVAVELGAKPGAPVGTAERSVSSDEGGLRRMAWLPATAGLAVGGVGAYFLLKAKSQHDALVRQDPSIRGEDAARAIADEGRTAQTIGLALAGVGVAGLAAGGAMYWFGGAPVTPVVAVGPQGAMVGFSGVLP